MLHLLLLVLASLSLLVSGQTNPDFFYKLSLQWPPSVCSTSTSQCGTTIPKIFTIHGLWPQFITNDKPVPPYDPINNKCTNVVPTKPSEILVPLQPLKDKLEKLWPSILKGKTNEEFWKHEWEKHATCSDFPDDPYGFFAAALCLVNKNNLSDVFQTGSWLVPREAVYKGKDIRDAIKAKMGAFPEISCKKKDNRLKLTEMRLCFDRAKPPFVIRDCPTKYSNGCSSDNDEIVFPLS
ncbi:hypothetical protein CRYUN_Cryun41cG0068800 [Craigia yunnanensis]